MTAGPSLVGQTLAGRFHVAELLGEGAMAVVYRGTQDRPPFEVALKVLHPHLVGDATFVARFHREAAAAARIVHPSSVQVVDHGADGSLLYIAMELVHGKDLFETLVSEKRLSERRAARILVHVLDALAAAHAVGIVHRDLKPENIMLVEDSAADGGERIKVLDFGIAKILEKGLEGAAAAALTTIGTLVGTPAYMSPEQCCGEPVEARSDVYSAGVVLYQLVTGSLPFVAESPIDFAVHHVNTPPMPPKLDCSGNRAAASGGDPSRACKTPRESPGERRRSARSPDGPLPALRSTQLPLGTVKGMASLPAPFSLDPKSQRLQSARAITLDAADASPERLGPSSTEVPLATPSSDAAQVDSLSPRVLSARALVEPGPPRGLARRVALEMGWACGCCCSDGYGSGVTLLATLR